MPIARAIEEINDGIGWVNWALGGGSKVAPFFRIPGLLRTEGVERYLASQHIQIWSADFPADDWTKIAPAEVIERALTRLEANHKGILLLHDIQARTVEALPELLAELKQRGYRVVHVVPAALGLPRTATAASQWVLHNRKVWPLTPIFAEVEPELPAPSPASFGATDPFDAKSLVHDPARRPRTARGTISPPPASIWLPTPSPQVLGAVAAATEPATPKPSFDLVPETHGPAIDIRRALTPELMPDDRRTGPIAPSLPRGPISGEMPRGAFP